MHTHTVFFWLWKTLSAEDQRAFERGLDLLTSDPNVLNRRVGRPAGTHRDVIDNSYDYGVVLQFESTATHDAYQSGRAHQQFLDTCQRMWSRVQVYDVDEMAL